MGFRRSEVRILSPRPVNPKRAGNLCPGPLFVVYPPTVMWANLWTNFDPQTAKRRLGGYSDQGSDHHFFRTEDLQEHLMALCHFRMRRAWTELRFMGGTLRM